MSADILRSVEQAPGPSNSPSGSDNPDHIPPPNKHFRRSLTPSQQHFRNLTRSYIVRQLCRHGYERLAREIGGYEDSDDESHRVLQIITGQLADERRGQFEDILYRLQLTNDNLEVTYSTVVTEIFHDDINWGRIVAFLAFSGSLAVFCAQNGMEHRVHDIVEWTESYMYGQLQGWIREKGGWRAFVEHFDHSSWTIDLSSLFVTGGLLAAAVAGGMFLARKLF